MQNWCPGPICLLAGASEQPARGEADTGRKPSWVLFPKPSQFPILGSLTEFDVDQFRERFFKTAGRIVERMGMNATHMVSSTKKGFQEIFGGKD